MNSPYVKYMSLGSEAPPAEHSSDDYTIPKVIERLEYAKRVEKRNISPRSEIFLQLYKDAAENALLVKDDEARQQFCIQLYRYDKFIHYNGFMSKKPTEQQQTLEQQLLKLKKLEYYARYGDYFARELAALRESAALLKTENHEELQQYWTVINTKMQYERKLFEKEGQGLEPGRMPTLLAIWNAAIEVKLPTERVEWVIQQYAERNLLVHSTVTELIQVGHWSKLAELLYNDEKDICLVIPPGMQEDIEKLSAIIRSLITKFFIIEEGDENDPMTWRANDYGSNYRNELRAKKQVKADRIKTDLVTSMVKSASEAAMQREKYAKLADRAILGKRKASQPFSLGQAVLEKKIKELEKVVGIQVQVSKRERELDVLYSKRDEAVDALGDMNIRNDSR